MNKAQTKYAVAVMQAHLDGKPIECQRIGTLTEFWIADNNNPELSWNWEEFNYRVKPEPRVFRVWIRENSIYAYHESHAIKSWQSSGWKLIEVVEKLP